VKEAKPHRISRRRPKIIGDVVRNFSYERPKVKPYVSEKEGRTTKTERKKYKETWKLIPDAT